VATPSATGTTAAGTGASGADGGGGGSSIGIIIAIIAVVLLCFGVIGAVMFMRSKKDEAGGKAKKDGTWAQSFENPAYEDIAPQGDGYLSVEPGAV